MSPSRTPRGHRRKGPSSSEIHVWKTQVTWKLYGTRGMLDTSGISQPARHPGGAGVRAHTGDGSHGRPPFLAADAPQSKEKLLCSDLLTSPPPGGPWMSEALYNMWLPLYLVPPSDLWSHMTSPTFQLCFSQDTH